MFYTLRLKHRPANALDCKYIHVDTIMNSAQIKANWKQWAVRLSSFFCYTTSRLPLSSCYVHETSAALKGLLVFPSLSQPRKEARRDLRPLAFLADALWQCWAALLFYAAYPLMMHNASPSAPLPGCIHADLQALVQSVKKRPDAGLVSIPRSHWGCRDIPRGDSIPP